MIATGLLIPFNPLPRKNWEHDSEVKERVPPHLYLGSDSEEDKSWDPEDWDTDDNSDDDEEGSRKSDDSEEYFKTLQKHMSNLLPGEAKEGKKPKAASRAHLLDLKKPAPSIQLCYYFYQLVRSIKEWRAMDRARRKHHIIRDYEKSIEKYDRIEQQRIEDEIQTNRKRVILEAYRSLQRLKRNSVVKVNKSAVVEEYTKELYRRDADTVKTNFYSGQLKNWGIENKFRIDAETEQARIQGEIDHQNWLQAERLRVRDETVSNDDAILNEDKALTRQVDKIMLKSGLVQYSKNDSKDQENLINNIMAANTTAVKKRKKEKEVKVAVAEDEDSSFLLLKLNSKDTSINLDDIRNNLKSKRKRRTYVSPFEGEKFLDTGDVLTTQCMNIQEVGALGLAAELAKGACPIMETLILKDCKVTTQGLCRIFQGIKISNLSTISTLNLRNNFLGPNSISYLKDLQRAGLFMNLKVLNLADNELRDEGVTAILEVIMERHFTHLRELYMQRNSITDHGFNKFMRFIKSVKDVYCPNLDRLGLENNLVSVESRHMWRPYPSYISY